MTQKSTLIAAAFILAGMLAVCMPIVVTDSAPDAPDEQIIAADGDSLFTILPAPYRLVFPYNNPILFGIGTSPYTTITYHPGSGLSNIVTVDLPTGKHIIHADAPDVTENTTFYLEVTAYDSINDISESITLAIYVGDYTVTVSYGADTIIGGDDEDKDKDKNDKSGWPILYWCIIALVIGLFLGIILKAVLF